METISTFNIVDYDSDDSQSNVSDSVNLKEHTKISSSDIFQSTEREFNPSNENLVSQSSDINDEIILSVFWKRGKLGAAYFTCCNSELHVLNDVVDVRPDFLNLKTLLNQVQPSQVLTSGGSSEEFVQILKEAMGEKSYENIDQDIGPRKILFMSTAKKEFSYDACKRHIQRIRLGFEPESSNKDEHILFVNSLIDIAQESMVVSLGMLVKYLEKYLQQHYLSHDGFRVMFLNHVSLANLVSMSENTYKALQIFNAKVHPSAFKRNLSGSNREGLSLFGIFNRCKTAAGTKRMKEIFTNPCKDMDTLNERLDAIEFCYKPQYQHVVRSITDCIKKIESVTGILSSIYRVKVNIGLWKSLYSSLYNAILIGEICQRYSTNAKLLEKVAKSITSDVHEVAHYIDQVVDFEESSVKDRFTVRNGIDNNLDLLRQKFSQIPDILIKVAEIELQDLPNFIEQCSIIYITELGYLLSVPIWKGNGANAAEYELQNFEVKFIVNNYVHYKTPRCAELDNVLGDSVAEISDIEAKIMVALIQFIHTRIKDIVNAFKLIAELDCVISFATVASENNYRRPILTNGNEFEIIQGRHPLLELCIDNFVPNDLKLERKGGFIKILTGPNASGKSVYLKQVALISFLAHLGSFVPAQRAVIPILDHIHSRIQTVESISTSLSAFLIDLKQMSLALYNSTPRSLIIIDEFGKGTTEIDGLSLLAGSLLHFVERKENCPYVLVSSHFHKLPQLLPETPMISLQQMDYLIENDEIVYLHKMKPGSCGSSLTHLAAKSAGLAKKAIKRSLEILEGSALLEANPQLKITKTMIKEILFMENLFKFTLRQTSETSTKEELLDTDSNTKTSASHEF